MSDTDIIKVHDYDSNYDSSSNYSQGRIVRVGTTKVRKIGVESVDEENENEHDDDGMIVDTDFI